MISENTRQHCRVHVGLYRLRLEREARRPQTIEEARGFNWQALRDQELELARVKHVEQLMDAGTYGACQHCGQQIDEERLLARPLTVLCGLCQRQHEQSTIGRHASWINKTA
jgi:RNA polymerase-binding transcription factor DksA